MKFSEIIKNSFGTVFVQIIIGAVAGGASAYVIIENTAEKDVLAKVNENSANINDIRGRVGKIEASMADLKEELEHEITQHNEEIAKHNGEIEKLRDLRKKVEQEIAIYNEKIKEQNEKIEAHNMESDEWREKTKAGLKAEVSKHTADEELHDER